MLPSGRSLADAGDGIYTLADADDEAAKDVLLHGEPVAIDLAAFGTAIDEHLADLPRAAIEAERARRGCALRSRFPTAPIIPGVTDVPDACPAGGSR